MPPLVDSASKSSSSTAAPPSRPPFQFSTIGKEPQLLKRISAPGPDDDYQDVSTSCSSPEHSPPPEHDEVTRSKASLLQKLTGGETDTVSPSDLEPGTSTVKPSSVFDPAFATLFSANVVQTPSMPTPKRRSRASSDTDMSLSEATPRAERIVPSLSLAPIAPMDGVVGSVTNNSSFTSVDGLELTYPATEGHLSASQDSHRSPSMDTDINADQEHSMQLNNVIVHPKSKTFQTSKVLAAIASLERELQLVASQTLLALDKANRAEAAAEKSLNIAKDVHAMAQQSVATANAANIAVDNALTRLVNLRQCYTEEHVADEHHRGDLLKRDIRRGLNPSPDSERPGLGNAVLRLSLSTEALKLTPELDPSAKKRKRGSDEVDSSSILTAGLSKETVLFLDRTVEMEAEAAREAWVQEVERRSAVPPGPAQRTAHEKKENEAIIHRRENEQAVSNGPSQSELVDDDTNMSLDKPNVGGPKQNSTRRNSSSEQSMEQELRAQREREVMEHKLEIARFQMQERDLHHKQKGAEGTSTTANEPKAHSASLMTKEPPTLVPATTTTANILEQNVQQVPQPKPGVSDASRMEEVKMRLAREKQRVSPTMGQGSSLAPSATQTLSQQNVIHGKHLEEAFKFVADAGRLDSQGQAQAENDVLAAIKPRGRGTARGSAEAKDTPNLSVGNVTAQKTLVASAQLKQRGKTVVPQSMSSVDSPPLHHPTSPYFTMTKQLPPLSPVAINYGSFPHDPLGQTVEPRDQDSRRVSLPPMECIAEGDQPESDNTAIKCLPSSRAPQKRKQGEKKAAKSQQNIDNSGGMDLRPSSMESRPHKRDAVPNVPAAISPTLFGSDVLPKLEPISPTVPQFVIPQCTPAQEAENPPSSVGAQPVIVSSQQNEHIDSPAPTSTSQPSHDSYQVSSGSETRSKPPSKMAERGPRIDSTNASRPQPDSGPAMAAIEGVSKASSGQSGNASTFLKTSHGGHRELSGSAASSKHPSRSGLVDHNVGGKAPLPINGQQTAHETRRDSKAITTAGLNLNAPAAIVDVPAARISENPPIKAGAPLNASQTLNPTGHSNWAETSQQPIQPKSIVSDTRPVRSRSRSRHSFTPPPITNNRKRSRKVMEGDHWSPGQEKWARRDSRMPLRRRSRSPVQHLPLTHRFSKSTNPSYSYRLEDDIYRPVESPDYDDEMHRGQPTLLERLSTQDPSHRHGHDVPSKKPRFGTALEDRIT